MRDLEGDEQGSAVPGRERRTCRLALAEDPEGEQKYYKTPEKYITGRFAAEMVIVAGVLDEIGLLVRAPSEVPSGFVRVCFQGGRSALTNTRRRSPHCERKKPAET